MRKPFLFFEHIYTVLALLHYTTGISALILSGGASEDPGTTITPDYAVIRYLFLVIYAIAFLLLLRYGKSILLLLLHDKLTLALIGIICFSTVWSVDSQITLKRSFALAGTTGFAVYFATRYSLKQQLQLLRRTFAVVIALSFLFILVFPHYGIMSGLHEGAWRGIYTHKNILGQTMVLSVITFLVTIISSDKSSYLTYTGLFLSAFLLIMCRSSSSLVHTVILSGAIFVLTVLRLSFALRAIAISLLLALGCIVTLWASTQAQAVVGIFGKDLTFTGRTDLWAYSWELIKQNPWFGYGYGALWVNWTSKTNAIWDAVGWQAPSSHNGFIELWLALGLLGVLVFIVHFSIAFTRIIAISGRGKSKEYFFLMCIMILTISANITEATLLANNSIFTVLYVSAPLTSYLVLHSIKSAMKVTTESLGVSKVLST